MPKAVIPYYLIFRKYKVNLCTLFQLKSQLKFMFSTKATKICQNIPVFLVYHISRNIKEKIGDMLLFRGLLKRT